MSETQQRRIELQSLEDLRYLINNAKLAAAHKIDRAFPPIANQGEDAMKIRVQELVDEYILQTYTAATSNISINGYPATLPPEFASSKNAAATPILSIEEYEPLDTKLQLRARELAMKEEDLLIEIANLRREAPGKAVEAVKREFKEGVEGDEEGVRRVEGGIPEGRGGKRGGDGTRDEGAFDLVGEAGLDLDGDEVQETWRRGVGQLERLKDELPGTAGRLEKARRAGEYVMSRSK